MQEKSVEVTKSISGGYCLLTPILLCNVLSALQNRRISYRAVRTFLSCVLMDAARKAANRSCPKRKGFEGLVRYDLDEIHQRIGGIGGEYIRADLQELQAAGLLLEFSTSEIRLNPEPLEESHPLLDTASGSRNPYRPLPVPRRMLEFLTGCSKPSILKTVLAYLIRGLSLKRDGTINSKGSAKSSWLVRVAGISLRAAKAARKFLIRLGWLSEDTHSTQRKLNRTGAYFCINTAWEAPKEEGNQPEQLPTSDAPPKREHFFDSASKAKTPSKSAPLKDFPTGEFAPPIKDCNLLSEEIKTRNLAQPIPSGVQIEPKITTDVPKTRPLPKASILDVRANDLTDFERTETLYCDAVKRGLIEHSEANALNWIGAAVRARRESAKGRGDAMKIFCGIIRRGLWGYITQEHEEVARKALNYHRERNPNFYRLEAIEPESSSGDDKTTVRRMIDRLLRAVGMPEASREPCDRCARSCAISPKCTTYPMVRSRFLGV